jgi:hypothetical protein
MCLAVYTYICLNIFLDFGQFEGIWAGKPVLLNAKNEVKCGCGVGGLRRVD